MAKRGRFLAQFLRDHVEKLRGTGMDPFDGVRIDLSGLGWAFAMVRVTLPSPLLAARWASAGRNARPQGGPAPIGRSRTTQVTSRAFRTRGPSQPASMLPLIDMCNHSFEANCEVRPYGRTGGVELVATRPLAAGEALTLCYGKLPNDFLMMDYGFLSQNNPYDGVKLRFDIDALDAAREVAGLTKAVLGARIKDQASQGQVMIYTWQKIMLQELRLSGPDADREVEV